MPIFVRLHYCNRIFLSFSLLIFAAREMRNGNKLCVYCMAVGTTAQRIQKGIHNVRIKEACWPGRRFMKGEFIV